MEAISPEEGEDLTVPKEEEPKGKYHRPIKPKEIEESPVFKLVIPKAQVNKYVKVIGMC